MRRGTPTYTVTPWLYALALHRTLTATHALGLGRENGKGQGGAAEGGGSEDGKGGGSEDGKEARGGAGSDARSPGRARAEGVRRRHAGHGEACGG